MDLLKYSIVLWFVDMRYSYCEQLAVNMAVVIDRSSYDDIIFLFIIFISIGTIEHLGRHYNSVLSFTGVDT
ncbi:Uncharacterised protein [Sphingobacterium multivorum]|uniref:Uncharacterized protein n=1 Tax=Sphingobacterium multivorum TaxID=28454 RepID=A0A654C8J6_SPHMU|nr:Uncharacterised protein [Sphingobacterium multivorum]VXC89556.1 conserved hypothetical protein [Sphingobacterium multivorum]